MLIAAIPNTTGINMALILSANNCTGGFSPCACFTILIIPDKTVSFPTAVTCAFTVPSLITLPPINLSLAILCTGALSPVTIASFTCTSPQRILQSIGTCSPLLIRIRSPHQAAYFQQEKFVPYVHHQKQSYWPSLFAI